MPAAVVAETSVIPTVGQRPQQQSSSSSSALLKAPPTPPPRMPILQGHCAGRVEGSVSPSPLPAHVRLNFSCNVVVVQKAEVLETYERAVSAFSRPTDPDFETGTQQVGASLRRARDAGGPAKVFRGGVPGVLQRAGRGGRGGRTSCGARWWPAGAARPSAGSPAAPVHAIYMLPYRRGPRSTC